MQERGHEALWKMAEARRPPAKQRRLDKLLDKNQRNKLTDRERQSLVKLRADADLLMLQRSDADLLLKYRGQPIPHLGDGDRQ